jgi:hypothetical protein
MNEEKEEKQNIYVIPKNISSRIEFFPGFGMKEVGIMLIGIVIGACIGAIGWFIEGSPLWFGLIVPAGAFGFFLGKPNPRTGRNILDILKDQRDYKSKPQRYFYRYGSWRENNGIVSKK